MTFIENNGVTWNDERALSAYRIVQELISNCIKHSQATSVSVSLLWDINSVMLAVEDNGIGLVLNKERTGVGWWNIQQRAKQLNAQIHMVDTPTAKGFKVIFTIPLIQ